VSLVLDEHRQYLADRARVDAFAAALGALVRPGDVVLDLASGTGILGLLACQAGAAKVYAIEIGSIVEVARQIARDNGFGDRIISIHDMVERASLPEPVDLIVTDGAGRFGFEAGLIEHLSDARRRFLKPDGRVIPSSVTLSVAPVEAPEPWENIAFWTRPVHGLTFASAQPIALGTGYPRRIGPDDLLAAPSSFPAIDPSRPVGMFSSGNLEFAVERDGIAHGIGGWFSAELAPGVSLTNAPGAPNQIDRRNVFFPLREPTAVRSGDRVAVAIDIRPASLLVRWRVDVCAADGSLRHATDGSTFKGMLISHEDLLRTRPAFRPSLTPAGHARKTVLDLCDGARNLADIEAEVLRRHPDLFPSLSDAAAFVAEVVSRYAT
jgi:hypothetical protein